MTTEMVVAVLREVGVILGGTAAAVAVMAYLGKTLLGQLTAKDLERHKHELTRQVEEFKAALAAKNNVELEKLKADLKEKGDKELEAVRSDLKAKTDAQVERLKAELLVYTTEHKVRFETLHGKVADVLGELFTRLTATYRETSSFVSSMERSGEPSKSEKFEAAGEKYNALLGYFNDERLYIPDDLYTSIGKFLDASKRVIEGFKIGLERYEAGRRERRGEAPLDFWKKAEADAAALKPLYDEIRRHVQVLLGFASPAAKPAGDGV
jgi:hypothetical protein